MKNNVLVVMILSCIFIVIFLGLAETRERSDVLILKNGDRVTCEVLNLSRGMLTVKTDAMSTIEIKWQDVKQISSKFLFRVQDTSGHLYIGSIQAGDEDYQMKVIGKDTTYDLKHTSVVDIQEFDESRWRRFSGSVDLSYNYTKASNQTQFNFYSDLEYTTENYMGQLDISADLGQSNGVKNAERDVIALAGYRKLSRKWYAYSQIKYEHNLELQLSQRDTLMGGPVYNIIRTNSVQFAVLGGCTYSREIYQDQESTNNAEAVFLANVQFFKLYSPKYDISTQFLLLPNITTWGRVRSELNTNLRIEIIKDFFVSFSFYDSFDSRPPSEDATKHDYGITTGISWSFGK